MSRVTGIYTALCDLLARAEKEVPGFRGYLILVQANATDRSGVLMIHSGGADALVKDRPAIKDMLDNSGSRDLRKRRFPASGAI